MKSNWDTHEAVSAPTRDSAFSGECESKFASPWVRVVIVNFNSGDLLQFAVDGLAAQTMTDFEVVIVDNASTDEALERLALPDPRFRVIHGKSNIGFAAGANLGSENACTPWLAMLNPDAIPDQEWLAKLRFATERYPDFAMFGSTQLMAKAPMLLDGAGDNYSVFGIAWRGGYGRPVAEVSSDMEVFSLCAAAALYRRDVFSDAGGFAEIFFCYLEDVDLCFRLRLHGYRAMQIVDARVLHIGSATVDAMGSFAQYHTTRNGVWLMVRCMPWPLLAFTLPLYVAGQIWLMWRAGNWKERAVGLVDGLRDLRMQWSERRRINGRRRLSTLSLSRMLVWNPRILSERRIVRIRG
jgi:N-acetylglucosaminyl-diphospho-decaprenol L-rhamnosyltransferase